MTTAEQIDALIKERGLSRRQLAIDAEIPPSSLQPAIERNKNIPFQMLEKIVSTLGISIFEVLGDEERKLFVEAEAGTISDYFKQGYKFTSREKLLVRLFHLLNEEGQDATIERVEELTEIPKYQREKPKDTPTTPTDGKDAPQSESPSEGPQEGK